MPAQTTTDPTHMRSRSQIQASVYLSPVPRYTLLGESPWRQNLDSSVNLILFHSRFQSCRCLARVSLLRLWCALSTGRIHSLQGFKPCSFSLFLTVLPDILLNSGIFFAVDSADKKRFRKYRVRKNLSCGRVVMRGGLDKVKSNHHRSSMHVVSFMDTGISMLEMHLPTSYKKYCLRGTELTTINKSCLHTKW